MAPAVGMWSSETWESAAEPYLLARAREGADEALAELWRRILPQAYASACEHPDAGAPEVLVAEAAWLVVDEMQQGRGPVDSFSDHVLEVLSGVVAGAGSADDDGFPFRRLDPDLVQAAFARLPELEQRVLWHTTLEGRSPRSVAPALGLSRTTVAATAGRARGIFRREYLKVLAAYHPLQGDTQDCEWVIRHLPAHVRGQLPARQAHRLRAHVELCDHERRLMGRLHAVHDDFPALVVPLVLLAGLWTPGFLAGGAELALVGGAVPEGGDPGADPEGERQARGPGAYATPAVAAVAVLVAAISVLLPGPVRERPVAVAAPVATPSAEATGGPTARASAPAPPTTSTAPATTSPPTTTRAPEPVRPAPTTTTEPAPQPPATTLRVYSSGGVTRFGLQFATTAGFDLTVSNASGDGRLTVDNGAFSCSSSSKSSVSCRGGDGVLKLTQGGLGGAEPIVIRITDSTGTVHTSTMSLG